MINHLFQRCDEDAGKEVGKSKKQRRGEVYAIKTKVNKWCTGYFTGKQLEIKFFIKYSISIFYLKNKSKHQSNAFCLFQRNQIIQNRVLSFQSKFTAQSVARSFNTVWRNAKHGGHFF